MDGDSVCAVTVYARCRGRHCSPECPHLDLDFEIADCNLFRCSLFHKSVGDVVEDIERCDECLAGKEEPPK